MTSSGSPRRPDARRPTVTAVLDSWAVLRFLENATPAADLVGALLDEQQPLMSWINLGEVHDVVRRSHGEDAAMEAVRDLRETG